MRVSPVGFAFDSIEEVLAQARLSAECTHNHIEGLKGAQAVALAVFLARKGKGKKEIQIEIETRFGYDLKRTLVAIRPGYYFNESCQGTVPEAILSFLEGESWEDSVRNAISLGGDADTLACITGAIAEAFYGKVPKDIVKQTLSRFDEDLREVVEKFYKRVGRTMIA